jgi:hypothetical protein
MILGAFASHARAEGVEVRVFADEELLLVDYSADEVLDAATRRALRQGLPARVRARVQLWRPRPGLWDRLVLEAEVEHRIVFDLLEDRYEVFEGDNPVLITESIREVEDLLRSTSRLPLCDLAELDAGRMHHVLVEVRVEPLSEEEMRDLERWLDGGMRGHGDRSALSKQIFSMVKGRLGLADRERSGRSRGFEPGRLPPPRD